MPFPTKYTRQYDFQSYQNANPTRPLPADKVNADLNAAAISSGQIVDFLKVAHRPDGTLAANSITADTISATIVLGFSPPAPWVASTLYLAGKSTVFYLSAFYVAKVDHTSGLTFDASKWTFLSNIGIVADATSTVGLTAKPGIVGTAMRSDGAPALDQSIVPTWTGDHVFTKAAKFTGNSPTAGPSIWGQSSGALLSFSGGTSGYSWNSQDFGTNIMSLSNAGQLSPRGGITMGGGTLPPPIVFTDPFFGFVNNVFNVVSTQAASATANEVGSYNFLRASIGSSNPYTAAKIAGVDIMVADSGSATSYGRNIVAQSTTGFNCLLTGLEIDLNQGSGLAQGTFGSLNSSYNLVLSGNPRTGVGFEAVSAAWITGSNTWRYGLSITNGVTNASFHDTNSTGNTSVEIAGTYSLFGIDLSAGTYGVAPIRLPNNQSIVWNNATNTGSVAALKVGTDNLLDIGTCKATAINGVAINSTTAGSAIVVVGGKTLNVQNSLAFAGADGALYTLPASSGQIPLLSQMGTLEFTLSAANMNSTADQAIAMSLPTGRTRYQIVAVMFSNPSISLTTAVGGVYTAAAKGGVAVVAAAQAYSSLTTNTAGSTGSLLVPAITNGATAFYNAATLYLSLTTAQGAAATADITVQIRPLP